MIDALGKAGRAVKVCCFPVSHKQTEQMIIANEMIDMRMRDEDLVDASYLPRSSVVALSHGVGWEICSKGRSRWHDSRLRGWISKTGAG